MIIQMDAKKCISVNVKTFLKVGIEWHFLNTVRIYLKLSQYPFQWKNIRDFPIKKGNKINKLSITIII